MVIAYGGIRRLHPGRGDFPAANYLLRRLPAEDIVKAEEALPESLGAAPGDFMETFRYPLEEEREALTREDRKTRSPRRILPW